MFFGRTVVTYWYELHSLWAGSQLTWHPCNTTFRTSSSWSIEMCFSASATSFWSCCTIQSLSHTAASFWVQSCTDLMTVICVMCPTHDICWRVQILFPGDTRCHKTFCHIYCLDMEVQFPGGIRQRLWCPEDMAAHWQGNRVREILQRISQNATFISDILHCHVTNSECHT
jgi:hypothetical protein